MIVTKIGTDKPATKVRRFLKVTEIVFFRIIRATKIKKAAKSKIAGTFKSTAREKKIPARKNFCRRPTNIPNKIGKIIKISLLNMLPSIIVRLVRIEKAVAAIRATLSLNNLLPKKYKVVTVASTQMVSKNFMDHTVGPNIPIAREVR